MAAQTERAFLLTLLVLLAAALAYEAAYYSTTADEPSHLAAGYMYWRGEDHLYPSDTPPLTRMISGWIPRALGVPLPLAAGPVSGQNAYEIGRKISDSLPSRDLRRLYFLTRAPFLLFPLGITGLVWLWARQLWGVAPATLAAVMAAVEPTLLGHGALIKSDVPAAFSALLFAYLAWRYWRAPRWLTLAAFLGGLLLAVLTKFTLLPLIGVAALVIVLAGRRRTWGLALLLATVYGGINAAYQFQAVPGAEAVVRHLKDSGAPRVEVAAAKLAGHLRWPEQFTQGLLFVGEHVSEGFGGYLAGRRIDGYEPWYYPVALGIKMPVALQILAGAGCAALVARLLRGRLSAAEWLIGGHLALFLLAGEASRIYLGVRHVLPAYPFFFLAAAGAVHLGWRFRWARAAVIALAAWMAADSARAFPHGISYFNEWIGGPANGWKYLADSNVDWGQDLRGLGAYAAHERLRNLRTSLFTPDDARHYLPAGSWTVEAAPWEPQYVKSRVLDPAPGVYAISANNLVGYRFPPGYESYFSRFRAMRPAASIGGSIFVYRVP